MTDREKAIVMAYTVIAMLIGDKFDIFHKYVEEIMCRPVFSHEFSTCAEEIKEKAKPDFLKLCAEEEHERSHGEWIEQTDYVGDTYYECSACKEPWTTIDGTPMENSMNFCPNCGADMRKEGEAE